MMKSFSFLLLVFLTIACAWPAPIATAQRGGGQGPGERHGAGGQDGKNTPRNIPPGLQRMEIDRLLEQSVHREANCADCHGHGGGRMKSWTIDSIAQISVCGSCHSNAESEFRAHAHGKAVGSDTLDAPSCIDCHGSHEVRSRFDISSPTHFAKVSDACGTCHDQALSEYQQGIHGAWIPGIPESNSATCISCHGSHSVAGSSVPTSSVSPRNLVENCGRCHADAAHSFRLSVHAAAIEAGNPHAASCIDCHGSHNMLSLSDPASPLDHLALAEQTCARCHESVELTGTHGLATSVVDDFRDSFHGLVIAGGDRRVANCASCHGHHEIRSSRDPFSSIHPDNLDTTCGSCHPGAAAGFASGGVHHLPVSWGHSIVSMTQLMYIGLIIMVISGMVLHNALDFRRRLIDRRAASRTGSPAKSSGRPKSYVRFTIIERLQHWTLAVSFIVLVVSGFALKFGWQIPGVDGQTSETIRSITHRVAATLFMALSAFHFAYLVLTVRGRAMAREMSPRLKSGRGILCSMACCMRLGPPRPADWRDVIQMTRYNLGLSSERPRFGRFTYAEKMEYIALVWGSGVMIVTGLILWFEVPFLNRFPFWGIQLATVVHYFEAILATLAIMVWHFYFTMFNPHVFPLSTTMITGKISRHEMELEHPVELASLECAEPDGSCSAACKEPGIEDQPANEATE